MDYRMANLETGECWNMSSTVYPVASPLAWIPADLVADTPHGEVATVPLEDLVAAALPLTPAPAPAPDPVSPAVPFGPEIDPDTGNLVDHYTRTVICLAANLAHYRG